MGSEHVMSLLPGQGPLALGRCGVLSELGRQREQMEDSVMGPKASPFSLSLLSPLPSVQELGVERSATP